MDRPTTAACIATLRQIQEEQDEPARLAAEAEAARVAAAQEAARLEAEEAAAAAREAERLLAEEMAAAAREEARMQAEEAAAAARQAERLAAEEVAAAARRAAQLEAEAAAAAAREAERREAEAGAAAAAAAQARPDPDLQRYLEWAAGKGVEQQAAQSMLSLSAQQDIASYASAAGQRAIREAQQMIRESMQAAGGIEAVGNAPARVEPAIEPGTQAAAFAPLPPIHATELDPNPPLT